MLRNFHYEPDFDATLAGTNPTVQSSTPTWRTALRKMCDAWCEGLAAHRQYEHLRSRGFLTRGRSERLSASAQYRPLPLTPHCWLPRCSE